MIDISSDKEKVMRSLQELEFEFAQGNVSKGDYDSQKRQLASKLETLEVADRVKRLQGKGEVERPLEYWTEKKEEEASKQAKEELMQKYITASSATHANAKAEKASGNRGRVALTALLALIFFSGIGFGVFLMKVPSEAAAVPMMVNQSAFPAFNNSTNVTNTTTATNLTQTTQATPTNTGSTGDTGNTGNNNNGNVSSNQP